MDQNFDLSKYELQETASLKIRNAKDDDYLRGIDGEPVVFELYGPGSEQYARATHVMSNKATVRAQAAIRGKAVTNQSEQSELDQVERLAACTAKISANFPVSAQDVYVNRRLSYIRDQVERFINDNANFSKASLSN